MNIKLLEEIFLEKYMDEYIVYKNDYKNTPKELFYKKYSKIVSLYRKEDFMNDDLDEYALFIIFGLHKKVIFTIDWSGEEYPGEVKKGLNLMLKNYGIQNFKWRKDINKNLLNGNIQRGDFLPLLFKEFGKDLEKENFVLGFLDMEDDAYYYFVLPQNEFSKINDYDIVGDTKLFELYLIPNNTNTKLLIYIKKKFDLKINDIKDFMNKDRILIQTGDKILIKYKKKEIEELGGKLIIEEMIQESKNGT